MAIQSSERKGLFTEINITPLTDIFLVLLIIMMVIAPMFQNVDNNIKLPTIKAGTGVDEKDITVAITKDAHFFINSQAVNENQLPEKLSALAESSQDKKIVVKADSQTKTKYIMSVMNAAQNAGFEKLVVAGEPLTQNQQTQLEKEQVEKLTNNNLPDRHDVNLPE